MTKKINNTLLSIFIKYLPYLIILLIIIFVLFKFFTQNEKFENNKMYNDGLNNADKILFINLESRKDRLKSITSELKKQGVRDDKIFRINAHFTPGNGHLGCSKSHYDAMQYAIDNNLENVIVFEDDFIFSTSPEETQEMINKLFQNLTTNDFDLVLLTHTYGTESDSKYPFLKKILDGQSSSGYIINKHYFKTLQDIFKKSVDNMKPEKTTNNNFEPYALDQLWKEKQKTDKWFVFSPHLGDQDEKSVSTIQLITNYNTK